MNLDTSPITINGREYAVDTITDSIEGAILYVAGWNRHPATGSPLTAEGQPRFRTRAALERWARVNSIADDEEWAAAAQEDMDQANAGTRTTGGHALPPLSHPAPGRVMPGNPALRGRQASGGTRMKLRHTGKDQYVVLNDDNHILGTVGLQGWGSMRRWHAKTAEGKWLDRSFRTRTAAVAELAQ